MKQQYNRLLGFIAMMLVITAGTTTANAEGDIQPERWTLSENGASIVEYLGRTSLRLNNGIADLNDVSFQNGTIRFDISMEEKRGFAGVYFRWNDNSAEYFYFRPHMSGNPDSNQYTPRFNGTAGWQIYHSPRFSTPTVYKFDQWIPVKLVIKDNKMDVFINSDTPSLHVDNLMGPKDAGSVRFGGGRQNFHISNVSVEPDDSVETVGVPAERAELPDNLIRKFSVASTAVAGADVEAKPELASALLRGQVWQTLEIDESGAANLAKISARTPEINTLLVKKTLVADEAKTVRFNYGFSDRVTVFLNGKAIAHGDDRYLSRDYRHLGTVGLYDSVFLPLREGENELVFAVTEGFGGWAIKAAMDPVSGVQVE